jgi:hypothetical protein
MLSELGWLDFVLMILAAYRLAQLVSKDDGPFDVIKNVRQHARSRKAYYRGAMTNGSLLEGERFIANRLFLLWHNALNWMECPYCNGVWFAALCLFLLLSPVRPIGFWLVAWLAIAGGQSFLQEVTSA